MRKVFLIALLLLATLPASPAAAQGSPGEVIALINAYRAENGLPAYKENATLMQLAQGQADYLASIVTSGDVHAGPGGTRPRDRAYNAGYGGGATIFISEIVKYGINETPQSAVSWWKTSQPHNDTMLASTYVEIGAGVATDGNGRYYYAAVTGYISGGVYAADSASQPSSAPAVVMIPVTIAEPRADGSVVHIIRQGQTLWTVAAVYEVSLEQILQLNNLPEDAVIFPGDEITVKPASEIQATDTPQSEEAVPTATQRSTRTPSPGEAEQTAGEPNSTPAQLAQSNISSAEKAAAQNATVKLVVGIALVSILGVVAASFFIQRPHRTEPPDNDPFAPID